MNSPSSEAQSAPPVSRERLLEEQLLLAQRELDAIGTIINRLPGKVHLDETIQSVIDDALSFIGVDRIGIALIDQEGKKLDARWVSGVPMEAVRLQGKGVIDLDNHQDIGVMAIRQRQAQICNDAATDPRVTPAARELSQVKSFAVLPLLAREKPVGFMGFDNITSKRSITTEDISKFQRFVDTLSLLFQHAQIFDELEQWSATLETRVQEKTDALQVAHDHVWKLKEHLSAIVENAPLGIIATDPSGMIVVFNRSAGTIFHGAVEGIPTRDIRVLFKAGEYADLTQRLHMNRASNQDPKESPGIRNLTKEMTGLDGSSIPVSLSMACLHSREKIPFGYLFVVQDLREIRFLENQVIQGEKLKLLGQMAAGISHEINTPLGIIKGSMAVLREFMPQRLPIVEKHFSIIEQAATRGARFIREILDFSRPLPLNCLRLHVGELIRQSIEIISLKYGKSAISFRVDLSPGLPAISGDLLKIQQVLFNLIDNAIEAAGGEGEILITGRVQRAGPEDLALAQPRQRQDDPPGTGFVLFRRVESLPPHRLSPLVKLGDPLVILEVADQGIGISPDIQKRLFDPFFSTKHRTGTGLGLAIALSIMKRHHGAIQVRSQEAQGTRMILKFPTYENVIQFERTNG